MLLDLHREEGQGLAEYGLIIFIVSIVAVVALFLIGGNLSNVLSFVGTSL